jgi:ATP-dependent Clp protease protease subunit
MGRPVSNSHSPQNNEGEEGQVPFQMHLNDRIVYLSGEVTEHSIAQVIAGVLSLANQNHKAPITMVVSTYGGSVDEMFSLYDVIKYIPCPVHTVGLGKIMSAGVLLLASGEKGKRLIGRNARIMIHTVSGGSGGNVFDIVNEANEHVRQQKLMEELLVRETKMTSQALSKIMESKLDTYILPTEALKLGIVDKIIG